MNHRVWSQLNLVESSLPDDGTAVAPGEGSMSCSQSSGFAGTDLVGARPAGDEGASEPTQRGSEALPFVSVEPWEVERGDRLAGIPGRPVVHRVVFDQQWLFGDIYNRVIAVASIGRKVQVCVPPTVDVEIYLNFEPLKRGFAEVRAALEKCHLSPPPPGAVAAVNAGEVERVGRPVSPASTPMATSGKVDRHCESRSADDPCEGLGSVVAQDGDSSACRPNTRFNDECSPFGILRPRARLIRSVAL